MRSGERISKRPAWARAADMDAARELKAWCLGDRDDWPGRRTRTGGLQPCHATLALGLTWAVEELLERGPLDEEDEARVLQYAMEAKLAPGALDRGAAFTRIARASARREVLERRLPRWHLDGRGHLVATEAWGWSLRGARGFRTEVALAASSRPVARWLVSDQALEESMSVRVDVTTLAALGEVDLLVDSTAIRVQGRFGAWSLGLDRVDALHLWSDAFGVEGRGERLVLVTDEAWLPAEVLRLLVEGAAAGDSH